MKNNLSINGALDLIAGLYKKVDRPAIKIPLLLFLAVVLLTTGSNYFNNPGKGGYGPLTYSIPANRGVAPLSSATITFNIDGATVPDKINVYEITANSEEKNTLFFQSLLTLFGASESGSISRVPNTTIIENFGSSYFFTGDLGSGHATFSGKGNKIFTGNYLTYEKQVKELFLPIINSLGYNASISAILVDYNNGEPLPSIKKELADAIAFSFQVTIDGFPVIGVGQSFDLVGLIVDKKEGFVVKTDWLLPQIDKNKFFPYATIGINSIKNIPVDKFILLSATLRNGAKLPNASTSDINKLQIDKINVVYATTETASGYLRPVYLLSGFGTLKDGRDVAAILMLPAVKNQQPLSPVP